MESILQTRMLFIFSIALVSIILVTSQSPDAFAGSGGFEDKDNDGFSTFQGDCNDNDPAIYPGSGDCDPLIFLDYVTDETIDLADDGFLTQVQANGLIATLEKAIDKLADDELTAASGMLTSFMNKINSYINNNTIPPEVGQPLIEQLQMFIDML